MADAIQTDLIVSAIAEGFDKLNSQMGKTGTTADKATQKISAWDKATKAAGKAANEMKEFVGGAAIALKVVTQAFSFAADEAEKLGRVDVVSNIEEAKDSLGGLVDVLVQIPIGGRDFLQWMGDGAAGLANFAKMVGALGVQAQLTFGLIDQETAIQQINALVTDEAADKAADLTAEKEKLTAATREHEQAEKRVQDAMAANKGYKASMKAAQDAEASIADLRAELRKLQVENGKAAFSERDLAEMTLDLDDARQNQKETGRELWLAEHGLIDAMNNQNIGLEEAQWRWESARIANERANFAIQDAERALEEARTATIDNSQAISEINVQLSEETERWRDATRAAEEYAAALDRVRERLDTSFEVEGGQRFQSSGGPQRRAHGGAFSAGGAVIINDSPATQPETVVANRGGGGGYVLTKQDAQAALGGSGGGLSIGSVNLYNGMDLAAFEARLKRTMRL